MATAYPTLDYNVAFANAPLDTVLTWVDLASNAPSHKDVESLTITRGRQTEDDQCQTGVCTAVLNDTTRKYDPNNTASTFYPNVQPMKPVQVVFTLSGTPYYMHTGWVDTQDGWVRDESDPGAVKVTVPSNDGFELLDNARLITIPQLEARHGQPTISPGAAFPQEVTSQRIDDVMTGYVDGSPIHVVHGMDPAWPFAISFDTGLTTMQVITDPTTNESASALDLIRQAETTEPGVFFFDGAGMARFLNRQNRSFSTSVATFCDQANLSGARIPYESVTTRRSKIVNDARTTRDNGTLQQMEDTASIAANFRRTESWSTQHASDLDAFNYTGYQLNVHKNSYELLESLTLRPGTDLATWQQTLGREIGDRITVIRTPQGAGSAITLDYFIEGLSFTWGPGTDASVTWRLSLATQWLGWRIGKVGQSEIGSTTKVGY